MEKPDVSILRGELSTLRYRILKYLADFLEDYDEEHPYKCDIPIGDWCAVGLSSLELPHVTAMYYDEEYDTIYVQYEGQDSWGYDTEICTEDLLELMEGLD